MVKYMCETCGYSTKHKETYKRHLNRKYPCIECDTQMVSSLTNPHFSLKNPHFSLTNPHKPSQTLTNSNNENDCMFCGKSFKRKDNLKRHMESYCKIVKSQIDELESEKSKWEDEKLELVIKTVELENKVDQLNQDLINKPQSIITNTTQTNIDNSDNSKKTININSYGNESIDHLTKSYCKSLIGLPYTAVSKLIKDIHCNPKVPENHNLRKRNKKDKFIEYFDGNEWKVEDKKKQLDHLVDMTFTILENIVDMEDDIESKHLERFSIFRDKYYENRDNIKTNNINDAEIMIMNNSN